MAERLPVGATRNIKSPSFTSFGSNLASTDILPNDRPNGQLVLPYEESDSNSSNSQLKPNVVTNRSSGHNKTEAVARNSSRSRDGEAQGDDEWVEQDEPGVYITLTPLPGGAKDLKRVRFRYCFFQLIISYNLFCTKCIQCLKIPINTIGFMATQNCSRSGPEAN